MGWSLRVATNLGLPNDFPDRAKFDVHWLEAPSAPTKGPKGRALKAAASGAAAQKMAMSDAAFAGYAGVNSMGMMVGEVDELGSCTGLPGQRWALQVITTARCEAADAHALRGLFRCRARFGGRPNWRVQCPFRPPKVTKQGLHFLGAKSLHGFERVFQRAASSLRFRWNRLTKRWASSRAWTRTRPCRSRTIGFVTLAETRFPHAWPSAATWNRPHTFASSKRSSNGVKVGLASVQEQQQVRPLVLPFQPTLDDLLHHA